MYKQLNAEITILERIKHLLQEGSVCAAVEEDENFSGFIASLYDMVDEEADNIYTGRRDSYDMGA